MNEAKGAAVEIEGVSKTYGAFTAVKNMNLTIPRGECLGLLGPNGAGKSTLIRMIYGARLRSAGRVSVFGKDPELRPKEVKPLVGVVPQENCLDDVLTVAQNLEIFARYQGMSSQQMQSRIPEILDFMQLVEKRNIPIRALSGGMQRRLAFARAILHKPELLILDEPTTGLDPAVRHLLWEKVRELNRSGVTILVTTHYMEEAEQLCGRVVVMYEGEIRADDSPARLVQKYCKDQAGANLETVFLKLTGKALGSDD